VNGGGSSAPAGAAALFALLLGALTSGRHQPPPEAAMEMVAATVEEAEIEECGDEDASAIELAMEQVLGKTELLAESPVTSLGETLAAAGQHALLARDAFANEAPSSEGMLAQRRVGAPRDGAVALDPGAGWTMVRESAAPIVADLVALSGGMAPATFVDTESPDGAVDSTTVDGSALDDAHEVVSLHVERDGAQRHAAASTTDSRSPGHDPRFTQIAAAAQAEAGIERGNAVAATLAAAVRQAAHEDQSDGGGLDPETGLSAHDHPGPFGQGWSAMRDVSSGNSVETPRAPAGVETAQRVLDATEETPAGTIARLTVALESSERLHVSMRGTNVSAAIDVTQAAAATDLASRQHELARALGRHALEMTELRVRLTSTDGAREHTDRQNHQPRERQGTGGRDERRGGQQR
jgi:hypothetical protein